jgi:hypothetical protein
MFVLLYATTGGALSLLTASSSAVSTKHLFAGAVVGALTFAAARTWALTQTQAFAEALFFTGFLGIAAFFASQLIMGGVWTEVSDVIWKGNADKLTFLPVAISCTGVAVLLSEIGVWIIDFTALRSPIIPYSLIREQLETAEVYERARGAIRIVERIGEEISKLTTPDPSGVPFTVEWLSGNASHQMYDAIELQLRRLHSSRAIKFRAICNDDVQRSNRAAMRRFALVEARFIQSSGHLRILLINGKVGFVGIQLGRERQDYWPDYGVIIREPLRIAILRSMFENTWSESTQ